MSKARQWCNIFKSIAYPNLGYWSMSSFDKNHIVGVHKRVFLNPTKSERLHFRPNPPHTILFSNSTGGDIPLSQVHCTKGLGVLVNFLLSPSRQIDVVVMKVRGCLLFSGLLSKGSFLKLSSLVLWHVTSLTWILRAGLYSCPYPVRSHRDPQDS